jgi:hypothetical protein
MPNGKGGYHTIGLYLNTYSQHVWAFKYKMAGSAKTTTDALSRVFQGFVPAETFMSDGGKHFNNNDVREMCHKWGTTTHIVPAYSPWINGLVEGTNKILLHVLKRLCTPDLGEDEHGSTGNESTPRNWPEHLDETIQILNSRILPALKFSPKELLFGLVINTPSTNPSTSSEPVTADDVATQMAYIAQQRLDGYAEMVAHAIRRKSVFDKCILAHKPGEVVFYKGQLVQIYRSNLDYTFKTDRKLLPKWSPPQRVVAWNLNSYTLKQLDGTPIPGAFSARRLWEFIPREGTKLAKEQYEANQQADKENHVHNGATTEGVNGGQTVPQNEGELEESSENTVDDKDMGRASGDEDTATQEGGAHGVVDSSSISRDISRDLARDLACDILLRATRSRGIIIIVNHSQLSV